MRQAVAAIDDIPRQSLAIAHAVVAMLESWRLGPLGNSARRADDEDSPEDHLLGGPRRGEEASARAVGFFASPVLAVAADLYLSMRHGFVNLERRWFGCPCLTVPIWIYVLDDAIDRKSVSAFMHDRRVYRRAIGHSAAVRSVRANEVAPVYPVRVAVLVVSHDQSRKEHQRREQSATIRRSPHNRNRRASAYHFARRR